MRTKCYGIITDNKMEVKRIAGNIVPALATLSFAWISINYIPILQKDISKFRWGAVNLSNNFISLFEPVLALTKIIETSG